MAIASSVANISSTFAIRSTFTGAGTYTITNPGRSFRIIQILVTGTNGAVITTSKGDVAGVTVGVCTLVTGDLNDFPSVLTVANIDFLPTDNMHITVATGATGIVILCTATVGGQALTTTDLT